LHFAFCIFHISLATVLRSNGLIRPVLQSAPECQPDLARGDARAAGVSQRWRTIAEVVLRVSFLPPTPRNSTSSRAASRMCRFPFARAAATTSVARVARVVFQHKTGSDDAHRFDVISAATVGVLLHSINWSRWQRQRLLEAGAPP
jgi:hypothetical protein